MSKSIKKDLKSYKQQNFLRKVLESKDILFGAFSPTITKELKKRKWTEIRDYAVDIGLVTNDKDYSYLRDTTWPNIKTRTMGKLDNMSRTGTSGGPDVKFDMVDHLVLEIIRKESPVVCGIGVEDSLSDLGSSSNLQPGNEQDMIHPAVPSQGNTSVSNVRRANKRSAIFHSADDTNSSEELKRIKFALEVRKLQLEVWEMENTLNVEHCKETSDINPK